MTRFAWNLAELRRRANLSQDELARLSGMSQTSICRYESGLRQPTARAVAALAMALRVSVDLLLSSRL